VEIYAIQNNIAVGSGFTFATSFTLEFQLRSYISNALKESLEKQTASEKQIAPNKNVCIEHRVFGDSNCADYELCKEPGN
jgi:hypothetical protein